MIRKRRIRNAEKYLTMIADNQTFYVAFHASANLPLVDQAGFLNNHIDGTQILPSVVRKVSRFNAEGGYIKLKHLPKETVYRQVEWEWTDWGGNQHSRIVDVPYERYQRQIIPPPSEELTLRNDGHEIIITSRLLQKQTRNLELIKHEINLFLELFGECEILDENFLPAINPNNIHRVNWKILPKGNYPWAVAQQQLAYVINNAPRPSQGPVIRFRVKAITDHVPDLVVVGEGGFNGYILFGFTGQGIYILESLYTGNATYVLNQDWAYVSQLSKAEILDQGLHRQRIIHRPNWKTDIDALF